MAGVHLLLLWSSRWNSYCFKFGQHSQSGRGKIIYVASAPSRQQTQQFDPWRVLSSAGAHAPHALFSFPTECTENTISFFRLFFFGKTDPRAPALVRPGPGCGDRGSGPGHTTPKTPAAGGSRTAGLAELRNRDKGTKCQDFGVPGGGDPQERVPGASACSPAARTPTCPRPHHPQRQGTAAPSGEPASRAGG